jgi:hypothetical protein
MADPKQPEAKTGNSKLLAAAQEKAPSLTAEFVQKYGLTDEVLEKFARGELSPPPTVGPEHTADLHYVNGGWQQTPVGVKPEDVGKDAISR